MRYTHWAERRRQKLEVLLEEREELVQNNWQPGETAAVVSIMTAKSGKEQKFLENEQKELERVKRKQEQEIRQLMEHEMKLQEIRERKEAKLEHDRERERMRLRALQ